jgi:hypothetical protein
LIEGTFYPFPTRPVFARNEKPISEDFLSFCKNWQFCILFVGTDGRGTKETTFISKSNTGLAFMSRGQTTRIKREKHLSGHIGKASLNISNLYVFDV